MTGKRARRQRAGRAAFLARSGLKRKRGPWIFFFFLICKLYLTKKLKARYKNTKCVAKKCPESRRFKYLSCNGFLDALEGCWLVLLVGFGLVGWVVLLVCCLSLVGVVCFVFVFGCCW